MTNPASGGRTVLALSALRRALGATTTLGLVLVVPLSFLLFLQWPLREWVHVYSREANDLAQCLFALYVGVAITYASRRRTHLAADAFAQRYPERLRRLLARIASLLVLAPWSLYVLYAAGPMVLQSVRQLESFPETFNPGYFVIKLALSLMMMLVLLQSVMDALSGADGDDA